MMPIAVHGTKKFNNFYRILEPDDLPKQQTDEACWLIEKYYLCATDLCNKKLLKKNQHCKNGLLSCFILFFIYDVKYKTFAPITVYKNACVASFSIII
jgi:hypothetical protein